MCRLLKKVPPTVQLKEAPFNLLKPDNLKVMRSKFDSGKLTLPSGALGPSDEGPLSEELTHELAMAELRDSLLTQALLKSAGNKEDPIYEWWKQFVCEKMLDFVTPDLVKTELKPFRWPPALYGPGSKKKAGGLVGAGIVSKSFGSISGKEQLEVPKLTYAGFKKGARDKAQRTQSHDAQKVSDKKYVFEGSIITSRW
jgi:hypothetical protein